ncbi:HIT family hydrolase [Archaeoglobales archaeon]|nr:MAG: HIT family hydrolase [Archaeoglobales archaeon]
MERLFAPWRIRYILAPKHEGCIFCDFVKESNDRENLILYRGETSFIIMNRNPYNPGHVMIAPYKHVPSTEDLNDEELLESFKLVNLVIRAIRECMNPDGFNIGVNVGKVSGAGIEQHLHIHVVPRWIGDTSFMPVLADVQVIPEALEETYDKLKRTIDSLID